MRSPGHSEGRPAAASRPAAPAARARRFGLPTLAVLLGATVIAGSVFLVLHPVVLNRTAILRDVQAVLDRWQSALLLGLPASARRAGSGPRDLVERVQRRASALLREVGTEEFARRQLAVRRAYPGFILHATHRIDGVRLADRAWDGDVRVHATVHHRVWLAARRSDGTTWRSVGARVTSEHVVCRLRRSFGVWRLESTTPATAPEQTALQSP